MASIRKTVLIDAPTEQVWDALRDFGNVHRRVVPGFVTELRLEEGARIVTFANGSVARELLVHSDEGERRLVYAIVDGRPTSYSASVQVFDEGESKSRVVWIVDLLPNELAPYVSGQMDIAVPIMRETLRQSAGQR
jgi:carbon monoxide dehydrogenase subunit G